MEKKSSSRLNSSILQKIETLDNRLQISNILGKVMPVIVIGTVAVVTSVTYLVFAVTDPSSQTVLELPQTGDDVAKDVAIIFPENFVTLELPSEVILFSENGHYSNDTVIIFYAQKDGGATITVGSAQQDARQGQYKTKWKNASSGTYTLWAEINKTDGTSLSTPSVVVDIK